MIPAFIPNFVAVNVTEELDLETIKTVMRLIRDAAPSGTVIQVQMAKTEQMVSLVKRENEDGFLYMVPLSRDLNEDEQQSVALALFEGLSFDFEMRSSTKTIVVMAAPAEVAREAYTALCAAWAKKDHETWVRDRTNAGWRYGEKVDMEEKTHPLLRPWDQIPDQFRKPDLDRPQELFGLLDAHGYSVTKKA